MLRQHLGSQHQPFCPSWESLVHASCSCCGCGTSAPVLPTSSCEGTLHQLRLHATSLQLWGSDPRDQAATGAGAQRAHNFPRSLTPQVFFCECTVTVERLVCVAVGLNHLSLTGVSETSEKRVCYPQIPSLCQIIKGWLSILDFCMTSILKQKGQDPAHFNGPPGHLEGISQAKENSC